MEFSSELGPNFLKDKYTSSYLHTPFKGQDFQSSMTQDKSKLFSLALEKGVGEISKKIMFLFVFDKIMTRAINDQRFSCFSQLKKANTYSARTNRFHNISRENSLRAKIPALLLNTQIVHPVNEQFDAKSLYIGRALERLFLERKKYGFYKANIHYLHLKHNVTDKKKLLHSLVS